MAFNQVDLSRFTYEQQQMASAAFPSLMRKVYTWMMLAMAITAFMAYTIANNATFINALFTSSATMLILILAELGLVIFLTARINRMSLTTATLMFVIYSAINGIVLAPIFLVYTESSIVNTFIITAVTFAVMALFGYRTSKNLSKIGQILFMALIGLIVATFVNIFVASSGFEMILNYAGVLIFVGLTAWDSQKIKYMLLQCEDAGEGAQKIALMGALSLYLDFINLFLYLLRIFGRRD